MGLKKIAKKKKLIFIILIIVITISILSFYLLKTLPNTDASGFLVSINNSGGTSCYCSATLIEDDSTSYYIYFEKCGFLDMNYSFTSHGTKFYYESEDKLNLKLDEIKYVINKTEFYNEEFYFHVDYYTIESCYKMNLSEDEVDTLEEIIHNSGFQWFDYEYGGLSAPGGGSIEITIPEYHKRVEVTGNAPEGFSRIYDYVYEHVLIK